LQCANTRNAFAFAVVVTVVLLLLLFLVVVVCCVLTELLHSFQLFLGLGFALHVFGHLLMLLLLFLLQSQSQVQVQAGGQMQISPASLAARMYWNFDLSIDASGRPMSLNPKSNSQLEFKVGEFSYIGESKSFLS